MKRIESGLKELFKYAYATNCCLDNYSVTAEELNSISTFSSLELLENFKDLILNLLNFKNNHKEVLLKESQIPEIMNQHKTEIEAQLKIQKDLRNLLEISILREEQLVKTHEKTLKRISDLESLTASLENSEKSATSQLANQDFTSKILELNKRIDQRETLALKLESENFHLRSMLEEKFIEIEILKKSIKNKLNKTKDSKASLSIDIIKKHMEEKALEIIQNQQKITEKIAAPQILRSRENRKSYNSQDFSSLPANSYQRSHKRSYSDLKS